MGTTAGHKLDEFELTDDLRRKAQSLRIADAHCHIYPAKIAEKASAAVGDFYDIRMYADSGDAGTLIANGSKIGVEKYVVCSVATTVQQVESINKFIAKECAEHPEFVGLGAWHKDVEDIDALLDQTMALGLRGTKVHPDFQKVSIDDPSLMKLYAGLQERGMVLLIHMGDDRYDFSSPEKLAKVLEKYDKLKVDAAHFGGYRRYEEAYNVLKGSQAYYDVSSSLTVISPERAVEMVHGYGIDKMLFGVDFPMWNHSAEFARVMNLGLTDEEYKVLFYDNFAELYGI